MESQVMIERTDYGAFLVRGVICGVPLAAFGYTRDEAIMRWGEAMKLWTTLRQRVALLDRLSDARSSEGKE